MSNVLQTKKSIAIIMSIMMSIIVMSLGVSNVMAQSNDIFEELNEAMSGWGRADAQEILDITANATYREKRAIMADSELVARLDRNLNNDGLRCILENLDTNAYGFDIPDDPNTVTRRGWLRMTPSQQKKLHYARNTYQTNAGIPQNERDIVDSEWNFHGEAIAHNLHGETGNVDYRGKGNREGQQAIYDRNGVLVTNPQNVGTYDLGKPGTRSHWDIDVKPWIEWGNAHNDKTTREERLAGISSDTLGQLGLDYYGLDEDCSVIFPD